MIKFVYIIAGGSIGTILRYACSGVVLKIFGTNFPYGTLAVNFIGCFFIGLLASIAEKKFFIGPNMRLLLMIGFCGAFTTFSTFMFETDNLIKNGEMIKACLNIFVSVIGAFILFRVGSMIGEVL